MTLKDVLEAAEKKRRLCREKQWTFTVNGKERTSKSQAEHLIKWLERFKFVGDIAANADPLHFGLPWAGLRLLLEVCLHGTLHESLSDINQMACSDRRQMQALLSGLDIALYTSNRLAVYTAHLEQVPHGPARENFKSRLVILYADILTFLAQAISTYQTSVAFRTLSILW